jgi:hypothetical protein
MSIDMSDWSEAKKLKYSYLKRAFDENRGWDAILLMQWRLAAERHQHDVDGLKAAALFDLENAGQPQAIRALNLLHEKMGQVGNYKYNMEAEKPMPQVEAQTAEDLLEEMAQVTKGPGFSKMMLN